MEEEKHYSSISTMVSLVTRPQLDSIVERIERLEARLSPPIVGDQHEGGHSDGEQKAPAQQVRRVTIEERRYNRLLEIEQEAQLLRQDAGIYRAIKPLPSTECIEEWQRDAKKWRDLPKGLQGEPITKEEHAAALKAIELDNETRQDAEKWRRFCNMKGWRSNQSVEYIASLGKTPDGILADAKLGELVRQHLETPTHVVGRMNGPSIGSLYFAGCGRDYIAGATIEEAIRAAIGEV